MSNVLKLGALEGDMPIAGPRTKVKSVKVLNEEPLEEEILHAIAAAVVDYVLTNEPEKHQVRFAQTPFWTRGSRIAQLNHLPIR